MKKATQVLGKELLQLGFLQVQGGPVVVVVLPCPSYGGEELGKL